MNIFKALNFIAEFQRNKNKAKAIKEDVEKQPKSKIFGASSILSSILVVAFSFLVTFGIKWVISDNLLYVIAGAVIGLIGIAGMLSSIYKAIESWAFQLLINKRPITWIALAIWIIAIVASGLIIILLL